MPARLLFSHLIAVRLTHYSCGKKLASIEKLKSKTPVHHLAYIIVVVSFSLLGICAILLCQGYPGSITYHSLRSSLSADKDRWLLLATHGRLLKYNVDTSESITLHQGQVTNFNIPANASRPWLILSFQAGGELCRGSIMECSLASVQVRVPPVHGYLHGHTIGGHSMLKKS